MSVCLLFDDEQVVHSDFIRAFSLKTTAANVAGNQINEGAETETQ